MNNFVLFGEISRDTGEEADLLLFDDDEDNYSSHFQKQIHYELENGKKYVKKIPITNSYAVPCRKNSLK